MIKIYDVVALLNPVSMDRLTLVEPEYQSIEYLPKGQIGTVVEIDELEGQLYYLIEFSDNNGCEYAMARLTENELLVLQEDDYELITFKIH
jgi:hypothetical protein